MTTPRNETTTGTVSLTPSERLVLYILHQHPGYHSVSEIRTRPEKPIPSATTYRALAKLEREGYVEKRHYPNTRYRAIFNNKVDE